MTSQILTFTGILVLILYFVIFVWHIIANINKGTYIYKDKVLYNGILSKIGTYKRTTSGFQSNENAYINMYPVKGWDKFFMPWAKWEIYDLGYVPFYTKSHKLLNKIDRSLAKLNEEDKQTVRIKSKFGL